MNPIHKKKGVRIGSKGSVSCSGVSSKCPEENTPECT